MAAPLRLKLRKLSIEISNLTEPGGLVHAAVERAGVAAVKEVKAETPPNRSGALKEAWDFRIRTTPSGVVLAEIYVKGPQGPVSTGEKAAPSQYVRFVVFGTSSPIVSTREGGMLHLSDDGSFRAKVSGQAANPFPARAVKKIRKQDFYE